MNKGSRIDISLSDELDDAPSVIIGPMEFFSSNGIYSMSNMKIFTTPGMDDLKMSAIAESNAVEALAGEMLYSIRWDLNIRGCEIGEA